MNYSQRSLLLRLTADYASKYSEASSELNMLCPACLGLHSNRRRTLYVNLQTGRWICFRCNNRGRSIVSFLRIANLGSYTDKLQDGSAAMDNFESLSALRNRLLGTAKAPEEAKVVVELPKGYRTDWNATVTGRTVYRYLVKNRGLLSERLKLYGVGYSIRDCEAIFPITQNGNLVYYQTRAVGYSDPEKYRNVPNVNRQNFLYGYDQLAPNSKATLVEGVMDALALGPGACAILGKTISDAQVALLASKNVVEIEVMLDGDAHRAGKDLTTYVKARLWTATRVKTAYLPPGEDPASLGRLKVVG